MNVSLDAASSSFTALLELPPTQAVKLLHSSHGDTAPPFQSLSVTADIASLEFEPPTSVNNHSIPDPASQMETRKPPKRNLPEKNKKKKIKEEEEEVISGSKSKKSKKEDNQLPYVHVRARRGQATDSHSLAERARREKINARMKLLQELVPGCSKISGIALVLDEIINHVQSLQRQVEFLSMQLATVNPRTEFNLDHFLDEENASFVVGNILSMHAPLEWSEPQVNGFKQSFVQQWQFDQYQHPQWLKEENHHESVTMPNTTNLRNDSPDSGCMQPKQLKVEQA